MAEQPRIVRASEIPTDIVDVLQREGQEGGSVGQYPDRLTTQFRRSRVATGLRGLASIVEPVDRALGIDKAQPVAKAFHIGSLIGLRVAAACVDDVDAAFSGIAFTPSLEGEDSEDLNMRHAFAKEILSIGDEAYAGVAEMFEPLFNEWEQQLVPDVRHQRFLRPGFGIPMAYLSARRSLNHAADLEVIATQVAKVEMDGDIDWDAAFIEQLG